MKIALCQLNPVAGDIAGNTARVVSCLEECRSQRPDLMVFPELFLQGYPPRDLLEHSWFLEQGSRALDDLCRVSLRFPATGILVGCARAHKHSPGKGVCNSAVLISEGKQLFVQNKTLLPSYDVFDETRYFDPAASRDVVPFAGEVLGITICEDAWNSDPMWGRRLYAHDPVAELAGRGATLLINIAGSPFHLGKETLRFSLMQQHAARHALPYIFVNEVGGNDDLIFDGNSLVFNAAGEVCAHLGGFGERCEMVDTGALVPLGAPPACEEMHSVRSALVLGVRDYLHKCGFTSALVGLSGGIDSAVTAVLAAQALGPGNVRGVTMPSRYSSQGSVEDARLLAQNLGITFDVIPIEPVFTAMLDSLQGCFAGYDADLTEENLQARIRGSILMALSNKFGAMLLSTGNKSELAVGYCTLYGDMNGGLSVIADLPKTMVYRLARYLNCEREIIPAATLTKPPSAELRPDQKDSDSLPDYETLDAILDLLLEKDASRDGVCRRGFEPRTVDWIIRALRMNEYKRRQAPVGLKVTPKAFGPGRRFPLAARYERT